MTDSGGTPIEGVYHLPALEVGYTSGDADNVRLTINIDNIGAKPIEALTITKSGTNSASFTLSTSSINSITPEGSDGFTITPITGLTVGTYTATVTVSGSNGINASFDVSFTVNDSESSWGISLNPSSNYTFPDASQGYTSQIHTVTITNQGNQPTGVLTITLSGVNSSNFTLNKSSISNISVGGTDSFTVQPITGLLGGTYTATMTVSGDNGISVSCNIKFGVKISGQAQWAHSVLEDTGLGSSSFRSVVIDNSGNVYVAGIQTGTGTFTYGPGVYASGSSSGNNIVLVKYDSSGVAQWARSTSGVTGSGSCAFNALAVDNSGNVYAAGYQTGTGTLTYGPGITITGSSTGGSKAAFVKYNSSGVALWAYSPYAGGNSFSSVAVDNSGNVLVAGYQIGTGTFTYGPSITITGYSSGSNVMLVKCYSSGGIQWARSTLSGTDSSAFDSVAVDNSGNVYAAGNKSGTGTLTYGSGVTSINKAVLVKYNSSGAAIWASPNAPQLNSFNAVTVDNSVNVYATGKDSFSTYKVVFVKYNSSGVAQWIAGSTSLAGANIFNSLTVDNSGNVYAAGYQTGTSSFTYGTDVYASGSSSGNNAVLVKYNSSGIAQLANCVLGIPVVSGGPVGSSLFNAVAIDSTGNVYAVGYQTGSSIFNYGTGVYASGSSAENNAVLVKYSK